ncbi:MAG: response regulator [Sandaracinaceae bacterium]|nr:response regulator [Sandaracinaceae bacterium]
MEQATRVVVVDDEAAILEAVGRLLHQDGFQAELFRSPTEAIEACVANPPTFVLTDFLMAEMSGEELAEHLRAELGSRCPRIVCVTAWLVELRNDQLAVFDRVIEKPFAYCDLVRVLDELEGQPATPIGARLPWKSVTDL